MKYDIFISYKRKSLATANNLYYRLTIRGFSTFFDIEEMRRDDFDKQLFTYIDEAKDIFVILEEGSLDGCKLANWRDLKNGDWFCIEIAHALEKKKNIIPILLENYKMPSESELPNELKGLSSKNAPEFSFSFFEEYLNKLVKKDYITSEAYNVNKSTSVFKFYSNENCLIYKDGKMVCCLDGMSEEPFYLPVTRKGDFRFKCVNTITFESKMLKEHIDALEEREVEINWDGRKPQKDNDELSDFVKPTGQEFMVEIGNSSFPMIRVEGGVLEIGATKEQKPYAESNESPIRSVKLSTYYIGQFPVTQNIWELIMGYNKSYFKFKEDELNNKRIKSKENHSSWFSNLYGSILGLDSSLFSLKKAIANVVFAGKSEGHYPVENISHDEALEFVRRLSVMTKMKFALPTEEEWEYAARGGQKSKHYVYAGSNNINNVGWCKDNAKDTTHPVGEKIPNELGLYDMSGNVWEWTNTPACPYDKEQLAGGDVFIRRGGSWWQKKGNCRVSCRYASDHSKKTSGLGLRVVVRDVTE